MRSGPLIQHIVMTVTAVLIATGLLMIYSASCVTAYMNNHDSTFFVSRQLAYTAIGTVSMLFFAWLPYFRLRRMRYVIGMICLVLLAGLLVPGVGTKVNGAVRWYRIGFISIQPSEMAKLAIVLVLAGFLAKKTAAQLREIVTGVLPPLVLVLPVCALILLQPDLGTAALILCIMMVMLFAAGIRKRHLGLLAVLAVAALVILVLAEPYRLSRMTAYLHPWERPQAEGYHTVQSLQALGAGGLFGTGAALGSQKLLYLPEPHTDYILAVLGEEFGFMGIMGLIALYSVLIGCGLHIAAKAHDFFGAYLALGLTTMIGLQAVMNMGVVTGLLPPKGIPLPLVSYGGSSLIVTMCGIGMLLSIATHAPPQRQT